MVMNYYSELITNYSKSSPKVVKSNQTYRHFMSRALASYSEQVSTSPFGGHSAYKAKYHFCHSSPIPNAFERSICQPDSFVYHLLPSPRDPAVTSLLRKPAVYPKEAKPSH